MKLRLSVLMMMACATFAVAQVQQPKIYGAVNPVNQEIGSGGYFSINADGTGYSLKEFDPNPITGFLPQGEIMAGTDGRLYGTASSGGDFMQGVVYSFKADGTDYKVIHHFGSVSNDGASPIGNLVQLSTGELFGVTFSGGSNMRGTIYKVKPDGSGYVVVKHFVNLEGESPRDGLILASNGKLYGTTSLGTSGASGGIYTISQDGTGYSVLHSFNSGSGIPFSGVIQASDGMLYGTTLLDAGSNPKQGTIYKVNPDGTGYNEFHLFASSDGANPQSGVIEGQDGNLYGLIFGDGAINHNIVYKIKKDGTGFGVIHAFTNDLHAQGVALAQTPDGFLFGMGQSTLFKLMPDGSLFQSLATFNGEAGSPSGRITDPHQ
ncbi:MAG: choice-of-anchor tandem repeat GloVer-containing protein [Bacteroidota bacterium]